MEKIENKPSFINNASLGGLYMGAVLSAGVVFSYLFDSAGVWINNLSILIAFVGIAFYMGKRFVAEHEEQLVGFGRSLGFVLTMMCFAGIIYGVTTFIMYNHIDPEYYKEQFETAMAVSGISEKMPNGLIQESYNLSISSPILVILSSVFSMVIYGIFPALIIAAVIKTKR